ncbi:hypothetical protein HYQ44_012436 [Verticillium longisporum]|nr:hypothetical protein HYQ44_012436 [Verticillium longisporum]
MGLPCSRVEAGHLHEEAFATGVRIIATDRPGMGLKLLADHLKLSEYGVLGVSGGGPYALACAVSHAPERLKCVTVVCGIGPPDIGMAGAGWFHWLGFTFGWRYAPRLAAWFFKSQEQLDLPDEKRICAGGGYATAAATADYRFKAVAVVSPVNMGLGVRLGPQGQDVAAEKLSLLEQAAQARQIEAKGGEPVTVPIITPLGENPTEEALKVHDYYMTPRAQHPRSENKMLLRSLTLLANFNHGPLHTYSLRNRY